MDSVFERRLSRRSFLGATAAGGAALMAGGLGSIASAAPASGPDEDAPWFEATIPQLQALMRSRRLTSRQLTKAYLHRIDELNPLLGAVIETNPQAVGIAAQRDAERQHGRIRGPLHGIPVLLKDNIATDDAMETTAGSFALAGSRVPADAELVRRLRNAGAVILGKANLSEWANFRGFIPSTRRSPMGGAAGAASRATRTSSTGTRAARRPARRSRRPPTCAPSRSAPRPTGRSSARPATTSSSASSRRPVQLGLGAEVAQHRAGDDGVVVVTEQRLHRLDPFAQLAGLVAQHRLGGLDHVAGPLGRLAHLVQRGVPVGVRGGAVGGGGVVGGVGGSAVLGAPQRFRDRLRQLGLRPPLGGSLGGWIVEQCVEPFLQSW